MTRSVQTACAALEVCKNLLVSVKSAPVPPEPAAPAPIQATAQAAAAPVGRLDVGPRPAKNGRPEPRVLLVERPSADSAERWHRALELLIEAGLPTRSKDEDDD
jgi:hypothetical protein